MKDDARPVSPRWTATVKYRADAASLQAVHELRDIADLHDLIERDPNRHAIIEIRIAPSEADPKR
jgi:hypothetical protein